MFKINMYMNCNVVGDISYLEFPTLNIVDEYFEKHPNITPDDKDENEKIYQLVLKELDIELLHDLIEWRIQDLVNGTAEPLD